MSLYACKLYIDPAPTTDEGYYRSEFIMQLSPKELVAVNKRMKQLKELYGKENARERAGFSWTIKPVDTAAENFAGFEERIKNVERSLCIGEGYRKRYE